MLIQLTQAGVGPGPGAAVLVGSDHVIHAQGAAGGATLLLTTGKQVNVSESLDEILDALDHAHDPQSRKAAGEKRKQLREQRQASERQRDLDAASQKAQREAEAARIAAERDRRAAQASADAEQRLREAANPATAPRTADVTPQGIDLKHPAPQPHQPAPVGTAHPADPTAAPQPGSEEAAKAQEHERSLAGKQPGGTPAEAPKDEPKHGQQGGRGGKR